MFKELGLFIVMVFASYVNGAFAQANFKFDKTLHTFEKHQVGSDTMWVDFKFTNDGSEPLMIRDVKTSCDCTLAEWPKTPVQPGQTAIIRGGYKIEGKPAGEFKKNIIIMANTMPGTTILTIEGELVE